MARQIEEAGGPISGTGTRQLTQFYSPDGRQLYSDELGNYAYVKDGTGWYWYFTSDPNDPFSEGGFSPVSPLDQGRLLELATGDTFTGSGSTGRDQAAQDLDRAQIAHLAAQEQIAREQMAQDERQNKLNRLIDLVNSATQERNASKRYLNDIQPDLARFASGLSGLSERGVTPTIGYGNQLKERIALPIPTVDFNAGNDVLDQQSQQLINYNNLPAINAPGMAMGGTIPMMNKPTFGTSKRAVIVGDGQINGDEEVVVTDPRRGMVEVIPIMGRAETGAEIPFDTETLYGGLSPLYSPFKITSASGVPNKSNVTPTSLGYVAPRYTGDFAPTLPAAYGPSSSQYFERNTGMLLPNPSTILNELSQLRAVNPVQYQIVKDFYEAATDQQGDYSGLPGDALDAMVDAFGIQGRRATPIGIR